MITQLIKFACLLVFFFGSAFVSGQEPLLEKPGLVSTRWLAAHLDRPELRLIDARPSLGDYMQGHLPGAIYMNTETVRISQEGIPATLLTPERLAEMFGQMGIGNQHTVVIYSSAGDSFADATYIAYLLEWLGHEAIGVLDGGIEKWKQEAHELTTEFPSHPAAQFQEMPKISLLKTTREVVHAAFRKQAVILDARGPQVFAAGHIPSAENLFLERTLEGDEVKTWKSAEDLAALAAELGADGTKPVITYCTSGRQSSQIWFSLRHVAGLPDVSSYHGSWIQWTAEGEPVVTSQ